MPCNVCSSFLICVMREFTQMIKILWLEGPSFSKWPNQLPQPLESLLYILMSCYCISFVALKKARFIVFIEKLTLALYCPTTFLDWCILVNVCPVSLKESHPWLERQGKVAHVCKWAGCIQSSKQAEAWGTNQHGNPTNLSIHRSVCCLGA